MLIDMFVRRWNIWKSSSKNKRSKKSRKKNKGILKKRNKEKKKSIIKEIITLTMIEIHSDLIPESDQEINVHKNVVAVNLNPKSKNPNLKNTSHFDQISEKERKEDTSKW